MEHRKRLLVLSCVVWSGWLTGCTGIVISGSGGLGAVSFGVVELIIEGGVVLLVLLVLFGGWKLAKIILAAMSH